MTNDIQTDTGWNWAVRYIALIVIALILAAAIGSMELFAKTSVFGGKLSAAHLVRFLGYGTALAAFWMLGRRSTIALRQRGGRWSFLQHLILPVVTLIVVATTYSVALLVLKPVMDAELHNIYNWLFIIAIIACAGWVLMAVLGQSASLTAAFTSAAEQLGTSGKRKSCPACGAICEATEKFCKQCGKPLGDSA
jgi:L-cystine uptake protein TcyP (sodium:dicarboxylate symporter family)